MGTKRHERRLTSIIQIAITISADKSCRRSSTGAVREERQIRVAREIEEENNKITIMKGGLSSVVVAMGVVCCLYLLADVASAQNPCAGATLQNNCLACFNASTAAVKCGYCIAFLTSDYWYYYCTTSSPQVLDCSLHISCSRIPPPYAGSSSSTGRTQN
jgi:hypothetical protein